MIKPPFIKAPPKEKPAPEPQTPGPFALRKAVVEDARHRAKQLEQQRAHVAELRGEPVNAS